MPNTISELNQYANTPYPYQDDRAYAITFSANAATNQSLTVNTQTQFAVPTGIDITYVLSQPGNITYSVNAQSATGVVASWPTLPYGISNVSTGNGVYTITGTFDAANWQQVRGLLMTTANSEFTLSSTLSYPNVANTAITNTWSWTVDVDIPVSNLVPATYTTNTRSTIYSNTVPSINDGPDTGQTYTVTFSSPVGKFGNSSAYFDSAPYANIANVYSFTGNTTQVNANFANIVFAPASRGTGNTTYTYTQARGNVTQVNALRSLTANVQPFVGNTYTYTSDGSFTPSFEQYQYGQTNVLLVGAGGAAQYGEVRRGPAGANVDFMGGGGGGGEVRYVSNVGLAKTTYTAVVGVGGNTSNTNISTAGLWPGTGVNRQILYVGTDGSDTVLSGGNIMLTAEGGLAGTWDIQSLSPNVYPAVRWTAGLSFGGNGGGNLSVGNITGGRGGWSSTQLNGNAGVTSGNSSNGSKGGGGGGFASTGQASGSNGGVGATHPLTGNLVLGGGGGSRGDDPGNVGGINGGNSYGLGGDALTPGNTTGANGVIIINIA